MHFSYVETQAGHTIFYADDIIGRTDNIKNSLGYFFILRRYQGRGLGVAALTELFKHYAGRWEIYYLRENQPAAAFWPKALSRVGAQDMQVSSEVIHDEACVMHRFEIQEPHL